MADKLDMSLDTIVQDRRKSGRPRRSMRRTTKTTVTPVGGVKKTTKPAKTTDKVAPVGAVLSGESKILVSNLVSVTCLTLIPDLPTDLFAASRCC